MSIAGLSRRLILAAPLWLPGWCSPALAETIVFMRHGEKPAAGLGQLDCQGFNRSLALPPVLARLFGRPAMIFAPDPGKTKQDGDAAYAYVRPLATIEPTAIGLGMPVQAEIGQDELPVLETALRNPALRDATVYVAWEHHGIVTLVRRMLQAGGGDPSRVPDWPGEDFDSLYVLQTGAAGMSFAHLHEGLDGRAASCPF